MADHEGAFRSHSNYIAAFALLCRAPYADGTVGLIPNLDRDLPALAAAVSAAPTMASRTNPSALKPAVKASLRNAGGTELLLALGGEVASEDEVVRLTNNWAVVQAYYCVYHAARALIAAQGQVPPDTHTKTQKQFAALWADRPLDLPPWSLGASDGGFRNAPGTIDDKIHPWTTCAPGNHWDLAGLALRTTRTEAVRTATRQARERKRSQRRKAWQEEEKQRVAGGKKPRREPSFALPHLTQDEKQRVERRVATRTVIDYLYRLRVKTNYEDAAMFTDGPTDEDTSTLVNRDLRFLTTCTLLAHELHIRALVGRATLTHWMDDWLSRGPAATDLGVARRRPLLATA